MAKHHFQQNPTNYFTIHSWNNLKHPKINNCVHCGDNEKRHEWALKKGKEHARGIENYIELCKKCHIKYDKTEEWVKKNLEALKKTYAHQNPVKDKPCELCEKMFRPRRKGSKFCSNSCSASEKAKRLFMNRKRNEKGQLI